MGYTYMFDVRLFEKMMFSMFNESLLKKGPIRFDVRLFEARNRVFQFDY